MKRLNCAIGSLLLTAMAATSSLAQRTGNAQKGRENYMVFGCYQCHGRVAQGARGPVVAQVKYPFEAFEVFVRQPTGGGMPVYTRQMLSDQDLLDIYSYLQTLPGPRSPAELPALLR